MTLKIRGGGGIPRVGTHRGIRGRSRGTILAHHEFFLGVIYSQGFASSRSRPAALSGVMSRCGVPSISKPTINLRMVAERSSGG